jgi:DNA-binding GntR family transcriptional regulator
MSDDLPLASARPEASGVQTSTTSVAFTDVALRRHSAPDAISAEIQRRILAGYLQPGDSLREVELAGAFAVARNTVREALRLLSRQGLVVHEVNRGFMVRQFTQQEVLETFQVRGWLEGLTAKRAGTLTTTEAAEILASLARAEEADAAGDVKASLTQNLEFHRQLVALLDNARLDAIFGQLLAEVRLMLTYLRTPQTAWLERNRELFQHLLAGRGAEFEVAIERYLEAAAQSIIESMQA